MIVRYVVLGLVWSGFHLWRYMCSGFFQFKRIWDVCLQSFMFLFLLLCFGVQWVQIFKSVMGVALRREVTRILTCRVPVVNATS